MTKRKIPFFFTFKGLSNLPIFQYLNFSFHRHFKAKKFKEIPEGWGGGGGLRKKTSVGEVWILSGITQCN